MLISLLPSLPPPLPVNKNRLLRAVQLLPRSRTRAFFASSFGFLRHAVTGIPPWVHSSKPPLPLLMPLRCSASQKRCDASLIVSVVSSVLSRSCFPCVPFRRRLALRRAALFSSARLIGTCSANAMKCGGSSSRRKRRRRKQQSVPAHAKHATSKHPHTHARARSPALKA